MPERGREPVIVGSTVLAFPAANAASTPSISASAPKRAARETVLAAASAACLVCNFASARRLCTAVYIDQLERPWSTGMSWAFCESFNGLVGGGGLLSGIA
jgi:hypothetical protein